MTDYDHLSTLISPLIAQFQPKSVLIVGETAQNCYQNEHNSQTQALNSPFELDQLSSLHSIDLAIVSEVIDALTKPEAMQWLGTLRNRHAPHIVIISEASNKQGWQLSDYLALGMKHVDSTETHLVFSYAIENYQRKKDWLNSKNWANPENHDKYRW